MQLQDGPPAPPAAGRWREGARVLSAKLTEAVAVGMGGTHGSERQAERQGGKAVTGGMPHGHAREPGIGADFRHVRAKPPQIGTIRFLLSRSGVQVQEVSRALHLERQDGRGCH